MNGLGRHLLRAEEVALRTDSPISLTLAKEMGGMVTLVWKENRCTNVKIPWVFVARSASLKKIGGDINDKGLYAWKTFEALEEIGTYEGLVVGVFSKDEKTMMDEVLCA